MYYIAPCTTHTSTCILIVLGMIHFSIDTVKATRTFSIDTVKAFHYTVLYTRCLLLYNASERSELTPLCTQYTMYTIHYLCLKTTGFSRCSWHPLIFGCYCDRVCRVLVGFCSQCTVYQRTGFSTAAGTLYNIRVLL